MPPLHLFVSTMEIMSPDTVGYFGKHVHFSTSNGH